LERIREASSDVWRDVGARVGFRLVLLALAAGLWTTAMTWLLGKGGGADLLLNTIPGARIWVFLGTVLSAGLALTFLDALRAVIVEGSLVRSLGDLILRHEAEPRGPRLEDHFAAFATPRQLSRLTRFRDLPLILFLTRLVLSQDAKSLIRLAATGVGREGLIRGLEDRVRGRAAGLIRRLRAAVILLLAAVLSIPQLAAWLFR
ncbi:MAG TPA: hypothetical protein VEU07_05245, partial [Candidatus Acidoferrum sp.]|nr:hypothetical protein [Candidatus Acidoferrum sp.]